MKLLSVRALEGPNVYIARPVLVGSLDMGELTARETREFDPFNERLIRTLPGLREHGCASGEPGAFIERLETGTYFGHTAEHVALELQNLAGVTASFGKTRVTTNEHVYTVVIDAPEPAVARLMLTLA